MSFAFNKELLVKARALRKNSTLSEVLLWNQLKKKQLSGLDFHRQKPIGPYIVDFYCPKIKLVIEIDGSSHRDKIEYDERRIAYLQSLGLVVLVFADVTVKRQIQSVLEEIQKYAN